jgi:predicted N-acetyltransferase YhbS
MTNGVKIEISNFQAIHAPLVEQLARRAFHDVAEGARPDQAPEFISHILGPLNPGGPSRLALARDESGVLGCLAAIPFRFRKANAREIIGYQIGYFFVDHDAQGKGVGSALLSGLTEDLQGDPSSFVYTFPNPRSIGRFDRLGYSRVGEIPTILYPVFSRLRRKMSAIRDRAGCTWQLEVIDSETAARIAQSAFAVMPKTVGFRRDSASFTWRTCGPGANSRYRFALCRTVRVGGESPSECETCFIVVLAEHRMLGIPFTIVVDILSIDLACHYDAVIRAAGILGNSPLVYVNSNLHQLTSSSSGSHPFGISVPNSVNPRPVELLMLSEEGCVHPSELAKSLFFTADWMGF